MPQQIIEPTIEEISGVRRAANLSEGWMVMKDASPETALLLAQAEALAKGLPTPTTITPPAEGTKMELTKEVREAADPAVQTYLKALETRLAKAQADHGWNDDDGDGHCDTADCDFNKDSHPMTKSADLAPGATQADLERAAFEKAVTTLPPEARDFFLKQQRETAEATRIAKGLFDERESMRFEAMAKELVNLPGAPVAEVATLLRKASEGMDDDDKFAKLFQILKAADTAIHDSGLWKEIGTGAASGAGTGADDALEAFAKGLRAADPTLSEADSIVKAAEENPELYAQYRAEMNRRNAGVEG